MWSPTNSNGDANHLHATISHYTSPACVFLSICFLIIFDLGRRPRSKGEIFAARRATLLRNQRDRAAMRAGITYDTLNRLRRNKGRYGCPSTASPPKQQWHRRPACGFRCLPFDQVDNRESRTSSIAAVASSCNTPATGHSIPPQACGHLYFRSHFRSAAPLRPRCPALPATAD